MAAPIVIDIPHRLTREEVRRRLSARIGELPSHIPGGVAEFRSAWPTPDRMTLDVSAMGQTITATLDIDERAVHATFALPPMLSFMSGAITAAIRSKGEQLLLG